MSTDWGRRMTKNEEDVDCVYDVAMGIKKVVDRHTTQLVDLQLDVKEIKRDLKDFRIVVRKDIAELKGDVAGLKTDVAGLKNDVTGIKGVLDEHGEALAELRGGMAEILRRLPAND